VDGQDDGAGASRVCFYYSGVAFRSSRCLLWGKNGGCNLNGDSNKVYERGTVQSCSANSCVSQGGGGGVVEDRGEARRLSKSKRLDIKNRSSPLRPFDRSIYSVFILLRLTLIAGR
jgi:hypothetical protein